MISLLWPDGAAHQSEGAAWATDLALEPVVQAFCLHGRYAGLVRGVLAALCTDLATISYRQAVLADLLDHPELVAQLEAALPALAAASEAGGSRWPGERGVFLLAHRLGTLEAYLTGVEALRVALDEAAMHLRAEGWLALRASLAATATSDEFRALAEELPHLRAQLDQARSVTLGVNLDSQLRPESATLLDISNERYGGPRSLLGRLLGPERDLVAGRTPLRRADERQAFGRDRKLFLDLSHLLEEVATPVTAALARFAHLHGSALNALEGELAFYLGAARLISSLQAEGYRFCQPLLAPPEARLFIADGLYNFELALRLRAAPASSALPVPSDIAFDETGRVFVLSGPNRGGKTTFARAVGLAHVLGQAGLPLPAAAARFSPVDMIYTLFPAAEQGQTGMGRLDEEAARLALIFRQASAHSLVLLNEPLGSTSPHEALAIARDVVAGLRMLGTRALLVTHLHELAHNAAALNDTIAGSSLIAPLVAGDSAETSAATLRSYRITRGIARGHSYAADIAFAHGLQLDQIARTLQERNLEPSSVG